MAQVWRSQAPYQKDVQNPQNGYFYTNLVIDPQAEVHIPKLFLLTHS